MFVELICIKQAPVISGQIFNAEDFLVHTVSSLSLIYNEMHVHKVES